MSFWGTITITNITSTIPNFGIIINKSIYNNSIIILNRIFIYHFLIGILIGLITIIHLLLLHNYSNFNPLINNNTLIISFYPFIFKDLYCSYFILLLIINTYFYWEPDILGNSDNQIIANSSITPNNILPEWYHSSSHSCLRSLPNKIIGIIIILVLFFILTLF